MIEDTLIAIFGVLLYLGVISSLGIIVKLYQLWKEGKF